ncbi:MAG: bifunctional [glutamate--ammonia ligase]-adenylyl-L-tyrosine phosphorylase/[glutamate--ammonia-ligase] adenylyltransferase [Myxococcaceae bacterium]|nr:MAG: bifunctional [glutamate--ammonia ligase]-adenylyl-L-tyrosine phosphorylase/[glutamate--ammonia-ligase] adenylyltransferase [Myxococcaceae bacterium]
MGTRTGARFLPREVDRAGAQLATTQARDHGLDLDRASARVIVESLGAGAPGVLPALFRLEALLPRLASELDRNQFVEAPSPAVRCPLDADADAVKSSLRAARDEALVRVTLRELLATVDVDQTAREWSEAASDCVDHALAAAGAMVAARNGPPLDYTGRVVGLSVLGMGKLGGRELNLGSDIDICLFYATDEGSAGDRPLAVHFARVGSVLVDLLADVTAQGFAFRVDLRLRPEGRQGPIACSHATAERYYHTWGRPWERAALLRARPIAGDRAVGRALLDALKPFVFRREVDPAITETLRDMLSRSRKEQLRDDARDLKLGSGGIREAEFFVQSWQLLWGGLHPSLQVPSTLRALSRLRALGLVSDRDARDLDDAWGLLRRVEHRIQTVAPYATHTLPEDPARLAVLARSLGYPDAEELIGALDLARTRVRELSNGMVASLVRPVILIDPRSPGARLARLAASGLDDPATPELVVEALGVRDVDAALSDLRRLARRPDLPLGAETSAQVPDFGPRLLSEVRDAPDPDLALSHVATLFERVFPPERYARWLLDRPSVLRGLVGLFGASEQLSRALLARPQLIETFVTNSAAPDPEEIRAWIEAAAAMGSASSEGDPEVIVGSLRRAMREAMLSVGVADLAGELSPAQVGERLTALAEAVVVESLHLAGAECAARYGSVGADPLAGVAVVAQGSLAAGELGHGGDLDLLFLHDHSDEALTSGGKRGAIPAGEYAVRLAQRTLSLLAASHDAGPGYAIDTRLRPSGAQGVLVTTRLSFVAYHRTSASWERQALLRARPVAGDPALRATLHDDIAAIAYTRGPADLGELRRLRARMELELGREDRGAISLKYGRGGLVDVEFVAQALQMTYGADPSIRTPNTRAALRALRAGHWLDEASAETLLQAESSLRTLLHATRLATNRSVLIPSSPATVAIARRLGYRDRAERSALDALLSDLARTRDATRRVFRDVLSQLDR